MANKKDMETPEGFELAGYSNVEAGYVLIADPCYLIHEKSDNRVPDLPTDWESWHTMLSNEGYFGGPQYHQLTPVGRESDFEIGVVVSSGAGDGVYPVFVRKALIPGFAGLRVVEVRICFADEDGIIDRVR